MYRSMEEANKIIEERVRRAEQDRLARNFQQYQRELRGGYHPSLAWLGDRMIAIGTQLKENAAKKTSLN